MNPVLKRGMNQEHVLGILANRTGREYVRVHRYEWNATQEIRERLLKWEAEHLLTPLIRLYISKGCGEIKSCFLAKSHLHDDCGRN